MEAVRLPFLHLPREGGQPMTLNHATELIRQAQTDAQTEPGHTHVTPRGLPCNREGWLPRSQRTKEGSRMTDAVDETYAGLAIDQIAETMETDAANTAQALATLTQACEVLRIIHNVSHGETITVTKIDGRVMTYCPSYPHERCLTKRLTDADIFALYQTLTRQRRIRDEIAESSGSGLRRGPLSDGFSGRTNAVTGER